MTNNITKRFIDSMQEFSEKSVSQEVIMQAKLCLADYIACAYAGAASELSLQLSAKMMKIEAGSISVVGAKGKTSLQNAALLNGIHSHIMELDDGHRVAMMHPGATVISALLPIAQAVGNIDGRKFLKAMVIGYEASIRLASAIQPSHKLIGFHGTGTCGTIGTAIALAYMLDIEKNMWNSIISAAATSAAGLLEVIDDGSTLKPYNIGQASASAINALMVGDAGFNGPDDILGGKRGFFATHCTAVNEKYLTDGFGDQCAIALIYRKPYAACRHCHGAIEGALILRDKIDISAIKEINISTYGLAVKGHDHCTVRGISSAKMSTPYSVAAALVLDDAGIQAFNEANLSDPNICMLMKKIKLIESAELSALVPQKRAAIVNIRTNQDIYEARVEYPKGEPENPITKFELERKYASLMDASGVSQERAEEILSYIYDLENQFTKFIQL